MSIHHEAPEIGAPAAPRDEAVCISIQIVGALPQPTHDQAAQIQALLELIERALFGVFPDFKPAYPPIAITTFDVRDDWISRGPPADLPQS